MAEKKKTNYQELTVEDLQNRLISTQAELTAARQKHRLGQLKKTSDLGRLRKDIARAQTALTAKLKSSKAA